MPALLQYYNCLVVQGPGSEPWLYAPAVHPVAQGTLAATGPEWDDGDRKQPAAHPVALAPFETEGHHFPQQPAKEGYGPSSVIAHQVAMMRANGLIVGAVAARESPVANAVQVVPKAVQLAKKATRQST